MTTTQPSWTNVTLSTEEYAAMQTSIASGSRNPDAYIPPDQCIVHAHPEHRDAVPVTPVMPWTYYGVPVSTFGEEGDWIALGHHEPRRFLAAICRGVRENIDRHVREGLALEWDDTVADILAERITIGYATFLAPAADPGDWWGTCHGPVKPTDSAVPVMRWDV